MNKSQLIKFTITEEMIDEAKKEAVARMKKWGRGTRDALKSRDIVGSLAHQGVERVLDLWEVEYTSYRTVEYEKGDFADIKLNDYFLDVKGTRKNFNPEYFYNEDFLVFTEQLNKELDSIDQFVFVGLEKDFTFGYIYGVMEPHRVNKFGEDIRLKFDNKKVKAYQMGAFKEFVYQL